MRTRLSWRLTNYFDLLSQYLGVFIAVHVLLTPHVALMFVELVFITRPANLGNVCTNMRKTMARRTVVMQGRCVRAIRDRRTNLSLHCVCMRKPDKFMVIKLNTEISGSSSESIEFYDFSMECFISFFAVQFIISFYLFAFLFSAAFGVNKHPWCVVVAARHDHSSSNCLAKFMMCMRIVHARATPNQRRRRRQRCEHYSTIVNN